MGLGLEKWGNKGYDGYQKQWIIERDRSIRI